MCLYEEEGQKAEHFEANCFLKYQATVRSVSWNHWRRLVKNIGWANQKMGGQKVVKSDKCMGAPQLLGGHMPGLPP